MQYGLAAVLLLVGVMGARSTDVERQEDKDLLAGTYRVTGWEPGQKQTAMTGYTGLVKLSRRGQGYQFKGLIDKEQFSGVGIFDRASGILSLSYKGSDQSSGCTQLKLGKDGVLKGGWLYTGDKTGTLGHETWTPVRNP
jgi:hypothetical protein